MTKSRAKKKQSAFMSFILKMAFIIFIISCFVSFVMNQVDIAKRKDELASIQAQIEVLTEENEEYQRRLNTIDEGEYILRIALEDLDYAFPKERRFYDVSRN